jgi:hypothetical protein
VLLPRKARVKLFRVRRQLLLKILTKARIIRRRMTMMIRTKMIRMKMMMMIKKRRVTKKVVNLHLQIPKRLRRHKRKRKKERNRRKNQ